MTVTEVTGGNVDLWGPRIWEFTTTLDVGLRCNASAVAAGQLGMTYPNRGDVEQYVSRDDAMVLVSTDNDTMRGYAIVVDDRDGMHGGCHCRWIGTSSPSAALQRTVYTELGDIAVERYGWLWGRVSHPGIRNLMINSIPGCALLGTEREIVTYKKPSE
jgi:hypothetical protein